MKHQIASLMLAMALAVSMTGCASAQEYAPSSGLGQNRDMLTQVSAEYVSGTAEQAERPFTDVPADAWYADSVAYCWENGLMSGTTDTTFSPGETMTRAMLVTTLYRAEGSPAVSQTAGFSDVEPNAWYADAVA